MEFLALPLDSTDGSRTRPVSSGRRSRTTSKTESAQSRARRPRTRQVKTTGLTKDALSVSAERLQTLNAQPINQHALKLLPKWALKPDLNQLHLLTLISDLGFASKAAEQLLRQMRQTWSPSAIMEYFFSVDTFEELFLAQARPLEAAHVLLAAVNILAEPDRYLPSYPIPPKGTIRDTAYSQPSSD